ncbi:hypothetical protein ACFQUU_08815 [Herbaspirillum sp. GCM10030257]|uniref:hypothetical protein n=1 Tax=Herbaspirillum sp. GCM10030257 TaxID=3273393 RepID=UPI00361C0C46
MPAAKLYTRPQLQEIVNLEVIAGAVACTLSASTPATVYQLQSRDYSAGVAANALLNYTVGAEGAVLNDIQAAVIATIASDVIVYLFTSNDGGATKRLRATATIKAQTINTTTAPVPAKFQSAGATWATVDDPRRLAPGTQIYIGVATATSVVVTGELQEYKRFA